MTMAISKAVEGGAKAVICASTGNTSASAAAYGARAGIAVYVLIPAGKIALGKLSQAMMHQATVIQVEGNFDQALTIVKELSATYPVELVNSLNPFRIEGQKTAAMEICDDLGDAPTVHVLPVGNAGNITAYWNGYREYRAANQTTRLPRMMGFRRRSCADCLGACRRRAADRGDGDTDRQPGQLAVGPYCGERIVRRHRYGHG